VWWAHYGLTTTHCNTLQHTATHCNTLQHTATHYNTLQHTTIQWVWWQLWVWWAHCSTLQHTATHCNTLQHTATHTTSQCVWSQLYVRWAHCNTLQNTTTHCSTLQNTATHCHTLDLNMFDGSCAFGGRTATHSITATQCSILILKHTTTHCHPATDCNTMFWTAVVRAMCSGFTLQHTQLNLAIDYTWLQHTATDCNKLQHTTTYVGCGVTGWRRCIGCLKLQVSFCKRATNHRALLRKIATHVEYGVTWYRVLKTRKMPHLYWSISAKEPYT